MKSSRLDITSDIIELNFGIYKNKLHLNKSFKCICCENALKHIHIFCITMLFSYFCKSVYNIYNQNFTPMKKYVFFVIVLTMTLCMGACDNDPKEAPDPEQIILSLQKVLPPRSFSTDKLSIGECRLIQTKEEFLQYFTEDDLSVNEQFRLIDFSKSSLIIGLQSTIGGWTDYHISFIKDKEEENIYNYGLLIDLDDTMVIQQCYHGAIVDKVPEYVTVKYDISMKVIE